MEKSEEEKLVNSLDNVLFQLAVVEKEEKFHQVLQNLLPRVLPLFPAGASSPVTKKLLELFSHINKRLTKQSVLPSEELFQLVTNPASTSYCQNFALVYFEKGFPNETKEVKQKLIPLLIKQLLECQQQQQNILLGLILSCVQYIDPGKFWEPMGEAVAACDNGDVEMSCSIDISTHQLKPQFILMDYFLDVTCYTLVKAGVQNLDGLSMERIKRIEATKLHLLTRERLETTQLDILKFVNSFKEDSIEHEDKTKVLIEENGLRVKTVFNCLASCNTRDSVKAYATGQLEKQKKNCDFVLENSRTMMALMVLFLGSTANSTDCEDYFISFCLAKRKPVTFRCQSVILNSFLTKSKSATNIFPLSLQIISSSVFQNSTTSTGLTEWWKLRELGINFCAWVFGQCKEDLLSVLAPLLYSSLQTLHNDFLLKLISKEDDDGSVKLLQYSRFHQSLYKALNSLFYRIPSLCCTSCLNTSEGTRKENIEKDFSFFQKLFSCIQLTRESFPDVLLSLLETLFLFAKSLGQLKQKETTISVNLDQLINNISSFLVTYRNHSDFHIRLVVVECLTELNRSSTSMTVLPMYICLLYSDDANGGVKEAAQRGISILNNKFCKYSFGEFMQCISQYHPKMPNYEVNSFILLPAVSIANIVKFGLQCLENEDHIDWGDIKLLLDYIKSSFVWLGQKKWKQKSPHTQTADLSIVNQNLSMYCENERVNDVYLLNEVLSECYFYLCKYYCYTKKGYEHVFGISGTTLEEEQLNFFVKGLLNTCNSRVCVENFAKLLSLSFASFFCRQETTTANKILDTIVVEIDPLVSSKARSKFETNKLIGLLYCSSLILQNDSDCFTHKDFSQRICELLIQFSFPTSNYFDDHEVQKSAVEAIGLIAFRFVNKKSKDQIISLFDRIKGLFNEEIKSKKKNKALFLKLLMQTIRSLAITAQFSDINSLDELVEDCFSQLIEFDSSTMSTPATSMSDNTTETSSTGNDTTLSTMNDESEFQFEIAQFYVDLFEGRENDQVNLVNTINKKLEAPHTNVVEKNSAIWLVQLLFNAVENNKQSTKLVLINNMMKPDECGTKKKLHELLFDFLNNKSEIVQECGARALYFLAQLYEETEQGSSIELFSLVTQQVATQTDSNRLKLLHKLVKSTIMSTAEKMNLFFQLLYMSACSPVWQTNKKQLVMSIDSSSKLNLEDRFAKVTEVCTSCIRNTKTLVFAKFFLYCHHPHPLIKKLMAHLWQVLFDEDMAGSKSQMMSDYSSEIIDCIVKASKSSKPTDRETSCRTLIDFLGVMSLGKLLQRRQKDEKSFLIFIWEFAVATVDDLVELVVAQGLILLKSIGEKTLALIENQQDFELENKTILDEIVEFLMEKGIMHRNIVCQQVCLGSLHNLMKVKKQSNQRYLYKHLGRLPLVLLECLSSLEIPDLQYAQFHTEKMKVTAKDLEEIRLRIAQQSPLTSMLHLCRQHFLRLESDEVESNFRITFAKLIVGLVELLRRGIGLNTRVGIAQFLIELNKDFPLEMRKPNLISNLQKKTNLELMYDQIISCKLYLDRSESVAENFAKTIAHLSQGFLSSDVSKHKIKFYLDSLFKATSSRDQATQLQVANCLCCFIHIIPKSIQKDLVIDQPKVIPYLYLGLYHEDSLIQRKYFQIWTEEIRFSTPEYFYRSILELTKDALVDLNWNFRLQAAHAIIDLFSSENTTTNKLSIATSSENHNYMQNIERNSQDVSNLVTLLFKIIPGRVWEGKGVLLEALVSIYGSGLQLDKSVLRNNLTSIYDLLIEECYRGLKIESESYLERSLKSLEKAAEYREYILPDATETNDIFHKIFGSLVEVEQDQFLSSISNRVIKQLFSSLALSINLKQESSDEAVIASSTKAVLGYILCKIPLYPIWSIRYALFQGLERLVANPTTSLNAGDIRQVIQMCIHSSYGTRDRKYWQIRRAALLVVSALISKETSRVELVPYKEEIEEMILCLIKDSQPEVCELAYKVQVKMQTWNNS